MDPTSEQSEHSVSEQTMSPQEMHSLVRGEEVADANKQRTDALKRVLNEEGVNGVAAILTEQGVDGKTVEHALSLFPELTATTVGEYLEHRIRETTNFRSGYSTIPSRGTLDEAVEHGLDVNMIPLLEGYTEVIDKVTAGELTELARIRTQLETGENSLAQAYLQKQTDRSLEIILKSIDNLVEYRATNVAPRLYESFPDKYVQIQANSTISGARRYIEASRIVRTLQPETPPTSSSPNTPPHSS